MNGLYILVIVKIAAHCANWMPSFYMLSLCVEKYGRRRRQKPNNRRSDKHAKAIKLSAIGRRENAIPKLHSPLSMHGGYCLLFIHPCSREWWATLPPYIIYIYICNVLRLRKIIQFFFREKTSIRSSISEQHNYGNKKMVRTQKPFSAAGMLSAFLPFSRSLTAASYRDIIISTEYIRLFSFGKFDRETTKWQSSICWTGSRLDGR